MTKDHHFSPQPLQMTTFCGFCILLTTEVVTKIFLNLNAVNHLVVPVGFLPAETGYFLNGAQSRYVSTYT